MVKSSRVDVSIYLQKLRAWFYRTPKISALRWRDELTPRNQPQPQLPTGPAHNISKNRYYTRDPRREVLPPIEISKDKLITQGDTPTETQTRTFPPTPGKTYLT